MFSSSNHKGHRFLHGVRSHRSLKAEDSPPNTPTATLPHAARKASAASIISVASWASSEASTSPSESSVASRPSPPEWDPLRCHPPMITSPTPSILSKNTRALPSPGPSDHTRRYTHHPGLPTSLWEPRQSARERAGSVPTLDIHEGFDFGFDRPDNNKTRPECHAAAGTTAAWAESASYAIAPLHPPRLVDISAASVVRRKSAWKRQGVVLVNDDVREEIFEAYQGLP